jgi:YfiH family protein
MTPTVTKKKRSARKRSNKNESWILRRRRELQVLENPRLAQFDWLVHGFSTRPGGASESKPNQDGGEPPSEKILNLGFTDWDTRDRVLKNRQDFFAALKASKMRVIALRQIHSDIVQVVNSSNSEPSGDALKGDALITNVPDLLLAVQTADCVAILLADKKRAIAAIHAGWRGTLQRIAEKALGRMQMEFGTRPQDVIAALGPAIGQCCFEVGPEVVAEFAAKFPEASEWFRGPFNSLARGDNDPNWLPWLTMRPPGHPLPEPRAHLDLIAANRAILTNAGVSPGNISSSGFCTACRTDLFFSYRRERITGRMMAAIGIRSN